MMISVPELPLPVNEDGSGQGKIIPYQKPVGNLYTMLVVANEDTAVPKGCSAVH